MLVELIDHLISLENIRENNTLVLFIKERFLIKLKLLKKIIFIIKIIKIYKSLYNYYLLVPTKYLIYLEFLTLKILKLIFDKEIAYFLTVLSRW